MQKVDDSGRTIKNTPPSHFTSSTTFKHNSNQNAGKVPEEYRFEGDEVIIRTVPGGGLLLLPKIITYEHLKAICSKGCAIERAPQPMQERDF